MPFCVLKCHTMRKCWDLKNDVCRCRGLVTVGAVHEMIHTYITEDMASLLALVFEINFQKVSDPHSEIPYLQAKIASLWDFVKKLDFQAKKKSTTQLFAIWFRKVLHMMVSWVQDGILGCFCVRPECLDSLKTHFLNLAPMNELKEG